MNNQMNNYQFKIEIENKQTESIYQNYNIINQYLDKKSEKKLSMTCTHLQSEEESIDIMKDMFDAIKTIFKQPKDNSTTKLSLDNLEKIEQEQEREIKPQTYDMNSIYKRQNHNKEIINTLNEDFILVDSAKKEKLNKSPGSTDQNQSKCKNNNNEDESSSTRPTTGNLNNKSINLEDKIKSMTNLRNSIKFKDNLDQGSILQKLVLHKHLYRAVQNKETSKLFKTQHDQIVELYKTNIDTISNILISIQTTKIQEFECNKITHTLSTNLTYDTEGLLIYLNELKEELNCIDQDLKSKEQIEFSIQITKYAIGVSSKLPKINQVVIETNRIVNQFNNFFKQFKIFYHIINEFSKCMTKSKELNETLILISENMKLFEVQDDEAGYMEEFQNKFTCYYVFQNLVKNFELIEFNNIQDINMTLALDILTKLKEINSAPSDEDIESSSIISVSNYFLKNQKYTDGLQFVYQQSLNQLIRVLEKAESMWSEEFERKLKDKQVSFNWSLYFNWAILEEVLHATDEEQAVGGQDQPSDDDEENPFYQSKTSFKVC